MACMIIINKSFIRLNVAYIEIYLLLILYFVLILQVTVMIIWAFLAYLIVACSCQTCRFNHEMIIPTTRPLIIAHRGCSGVLPEHTLQAYQLAIDQGANFIECDVVLSHDLVPMCLHESWMNKTTNVASVFPTRFNTYWVPDQQANITDYFSVDFTLEELKTLYKVQQVDFRDQRFNNKFGIPTLQEHIDVAKNASNKTPIGIYVEFKDPLFVNSLQIVKAKNTTFEDIIINVLKKNDYNRPTSPCLLQSFSSESLLYASKHTSLKLVQLMDYQPVLNYSLLDYIATYAYGVGPDKNNIIVINDNREIINRSNFVEECHRRGLKVHPYTFQNEDRFLAWDYQQDYFQEYLEFFKMNVDGLFTDFPGSYANFIEAAYTYATPCSNGFDVLSFNSSILIAICLLVYAS